MQAPQTRGPRKGPMRPAINFLRSRKDEKITLFQFFREKTTIFQLLFLISLNFFFNKLIMVIIISLQLVWCGPRSLKFVFMRPSKLLTSLMRPVSQFEFETPVLEYQYDSIWDQWGFFKSNIWNSISGPRQGGDQDEPHRGDFLLLLDETIGSLQSFAHG